MAKIRNLHLYGTPAQVKEWKADYDYSARNMSRIDPDDPGHLIILALPVKKRTRKEQEKTDKTARPRRGNGFNRYKEIEDEQGAG